MKDRFLLQAGADWPVGLPGWSPKGPLNKGLRGPLLRWKKSTSGSRFLTNVMIVAKQLVEINEKLVKGSCNNSFSTVMFVCQTIEDVKGVHVGPNS